MMTPLQSLYVTGREFLAADHMLLLLCAAAVATAAAASADCFWTLETDDADGSKYVSIVLVKGTMGYQSWDALLESDKPDTTVTHRVSSTAPATLQLS
jgi:hypothetical protein